MYAHPGDRVEPDADRSIVIATSSEQPEWVARGEARLGRPVRYCGQLYEVVGRQFAGRFTAEGEPVARPYRYRLSPWPDTEVVRGEPHDYSPAAHLLTVRQTAEALRQRRVAWTVNLLMIGFGALPASVQEAYARRLGLAAVHATVYSAIFELGLAAALGIVLLLDPSLTWSVTTGTAMVLGIYYLAIEAAVRLIHVLLSRTPAGLVPLELAHAAYTWVQRRRRR